MADSDSPLPPGEPPAPTPSEVVCVHACFGRKLVTNATKPVRRSNKQIREAVRLAFSLALLANERAGAIRLEIVDEPRWGFLRGKRLYVVPEDEWVSWPDRTVEQRLLLKRRRPVAEVFALWLDRVSYDPWLFAWRQIRVYCVLRGWAEVRGDAEPRLTGAGRMLIAKHTLESGRSLYDTLAGRRPAIVELLRNEIDLGVKQRRDRENAGLRPDPWTKESAAVREAMGPPPEQAEIVLKRFRERSKSGPDPSKTAGPVFTLVVSAIAWAIWLLLLLAPGGPPDALLVAITLLSVGGLFIVAAIDGPLTGKIVATVLGFGVPFFAFVFATFWSFINQFGMVGWKVVGVLAGVLGLVLLRDLLAHFARGAISKVVSGRDRHAAAEKSRSHSRRRAHEEQASTTAGTDGIGTGSGKASFAAARRLPRTGGTVASVVGGTGAGDDPPLTIEISDPRLLPRPTGEIANRIASIRERGPGVRLVHIRSIVALVPVVLGYRIAEWRGLGPIANGRFPWESLALLVITFLVVRAANAGREHAGFIRLVWLTVRGRPAHDRLDWQKEVAPIRPVVIPLLGISWCAVAAWRVAGYFTVPAPRAWVLELPLVAAVIVYLVWSVQGVRSVMHAHPVPAPIRLVALRVFGSPALDGFLDLIDRWQWLGPLALLDGPETAGQKSRDQLRALMGRAASAVVKDETELDVALKRFHERVDGQLRYPLHSIQCTDATWRSALERLLHWGDVVVMDLSGFSAQNRGCVYEIGRLFQRLPIERIVLLIDDETDLSELETTVAAAWAAKTEASPNHGSRSVRLRLLRSGGARERREGESDYEWKHRIDRIDEERLIAYLYVAGQGEAMAVGAH